MYGHLSNETHFGPQWLGSAQDICANNNPESDAWHGHDMVDQQTGHGNYGTRAHFRMWYAVHSHSIVEDKWSVIEPHHEALVCCPDHQPDEDWELWEWHVENEIGANHNHWPDYWYRWPAGNFRGFFQTGYVTRVGGLHNGNY